MQPPLEVELAAHDPRWAGKAEAVSQLLATAIGPCLLEVHHIGSTAIPDIRAKPIIDLMPVVTGLAELDECRGRIEALGYQWRGEYGLPGRRYCSKSDASTGRRLVHVHCYARGSPEIVRHLAFRDHLRHHPEIAQAYEDEKVRCQALHRGDSQAYGECKSLWIKRVEAEALASLSGQGKDVDP